MDQIEIRHRVACANGATEICALHSEAEGSAKLWAARRAISPALARKAPNKLGEDISIPRSNVPAMVARVREISARYDLMIAVFGHAGDGNLHPNILCDRRNREQMLRVREAAREIFEAAVELGGTLSGEHGIGLLKKQFMELDVGEEALGVMRAIKAALDPLGIMNPGKIFPDPGGIDAFRLVTAAIVIEPRDSCREATPISIVERAGFSGNGHSARRTSTTAACAADSACRPVRPIWRRWSKRRALAAGSR